MEFFWAIFQSSGVVGNILAAIIVNYLDKSNNTLLFIVLASFGIISLISFAFLRAPERVGEVKPRKIELTETIKLFADKRMLILLPTMIYSGFSQSFAFSKLPQAMGKDLIGWVMACFGFSDTIASFVFGRLADKFGKKPVIIIATVFALFGYILSIFVVNEPKWWFFIILISLGIADAGYNTTLFATIGYFFGEKVEAAFALLQGMRAASTGVAFAYSIYFSLSQISIFINVVCFVGCVCFIACDHFISKIDKVTSD